ncbi:hypothetical protein [Sphingobacterium sp. SGR-19]|uniref:baeRF3 domain-containing protein n=1 Tax=Sphingobacterium sp. SGR-19 TaxID=2710886 RepID=UPI0013EBC673|nr:hypothetical protein [Sphingobacterium sp. SGR-19]NGM64032.1 hypothetical protein [Sphingobacterium sp. SGR-19]
MQTIDLKLLKELTAIQGEPCISIYMPTHRVHPANATDPITFKNLYKKTLQYTKDNKLNRHEKLIQPLEKLIDDKNFWDHNDEGLAIFVSSQDTQILRLPQKVQEITCVADSFCVKPLFKLYHENQPYYLLALALDDVKLYKGDKYQIEELDIKDKVPTGMKEALGAELTNNHLHGNVVEGAGLHGYMEKSQEADIDMDRFFRKIDQAILEHYPMPPDIPLLLVTLPEHQNHFIRISKHNNFAPIHIDINPHSLTKAALLEKIQEGFDGILEKRKKELLERYQLALSENLSSVDINDVVRDVIDGKVEVLCIENGKSIDGHIDMEEREIVHHDGQYTDVINELSCLAFNYGGNVIVLDKEEMPSEAGAFTINRY